MKRIVRPWRGGGEGGVTRPWGQLPGGCPSGIGIKCRITFQAQVSFSRRKKNVSPYIIFKKNIDTTVINVENRWSEWYITNKQQATSTKNFLDIYSIVRLGVCAARFCKERAQRGSERAQLGSERAQLFGACAARRERAQLGSVRS